MKKKEWVGINYLNYYITKDNKKEKFLQAPILPWKSPINLFLINKVILFCQIFFKRKKKAKNPTRLKFNKILLHLKLIIFIKSLKKTLKHYMNKRKILH